MDNGSSSSSSSAPAPSSITRPLLSGALAGTSVDVLLYPLDTLKTRLQSSRGFLASGGFRGVYAGLGSVALGSAPSGALFFVVYEGTKTRLSSWDSRPDADGRAHPATHMLAASLGEIAACAVRVPIEVIKQRTQARQHASSLAALGAIVARRHLPGHGFPGVWSELYTGFGVTVLREVPFTMIQFPLWEALKAWSARRAGRHEAGALESAAFGSLSGAVAAGLTTPLDVIKTRMMLARHGERKGLGTVARGIWKDEGPRAFFKGFVPRTMWIGAGGAVFLGSYQWCWNMLGSVA